METEEFGPYLLLRRIAMGGMGELFLAQRAGAAQFSTLCVVKRIRSELLDDAGFVQMFLDEGRVAALIDHPNVVRIGELGEVEGTYFMTMEYVAGQDLGTLLEHLEGRPLDMPVALHIFHSVCDGLGSAHDALGPDGLPLNLVHRDINPHNILISYAGAVKLSDFGIVKVQMAQRQKTRVGVLKGKFGYLSPEQAQGREVDRRSDIYALGLLLYEMTTGQRAVTGVNEADMLFAAADGIVPMPSSVDPLYPPALEAIYKRATALRVDHRYQTVAELQADLQRFQDDERLIVTPAPVAELMQRVFADAWLEERRALAPIAASAPVDDADTYEADVATVTTLAARSASARAASARGVGAIPIEVLLEDFAKATAAEQKSAFTQAVSPEELARIGAVSPTEQIVIVAPPSDDVASLLGRPGVRSPAPLEVTGSPTHAGPEEPTQLDPELLQTSPAQRKAALPVIGALRATPSDAGGRQLPPPSVPGSDEEWWDGRVAPVRTASPSDVMAVVSDSPPPDMPRPDVAAEVEEYEDDEELVPPPSAGRTAHVRGRRPRGRSVWPVLVVGLLGLGAGAGTYSALVWHNSRSFAHDAASPAPPDASVGRAVAHPDAGAARTPARRDGQSSH